MAMSPWAAQFAEATVEGFEQYKGQGIEVVYSAVDTDQLAADSVTAAKIGNDVINSEHYVAGSIDAEHLASNSVTNAKLANDAVDTAAILDANVTLAKLATDSVDASKIVDGSVAAAELAADAVTWPLVASVPAGAALYFGLLAVSGGIGGREWRYLKRLAKR